MFAHEKKQLRDEILKEMNNKLFQEYINGIYDGIKISNEKILSYGLKISFPTKKEILNFVSDKKRNFEKIW